MKTMSIVVGDHVARWAGGSFIALWKAERMDEHVPDDMIGLPESLNKTHATREDIERITTEYLESFA